MSEFEEWSVEEEIQDTFGRWDDSFLSDDQIKIYQEGSIIDEMNAWEQSCFYVWGKYITLSNCDGSSRQDCLNRAEEAKVMLLKALLSRRLECDIENETDRVIVVS
jgi:hypothetical protein